MSGIGLPLLTIGGGVAASATYLGTGMHMSKSGDDTMNSPFGPVILASSLAAIALTATGVGMLPLPVHGAVRGALAVATGVGVAVGLPTLGQRIVED